MTTNQLPAGLRLRPASLGDVEAYVELGNAFSEAARGDRPFSITRTSADWQYPGITPQSNVCVVEDSGGKLVGGVEVWDDSEPPVRIWVFGFVHPQHAGRGIGSCLLDWAQRRGREAISRCPDDARVVLLPRVYAGHSPSERLVRDHQFTLHRHVWRMEIHFDRPPAPAEWPAGIRRRPYRHDADLRSVLRADYEAFRDHWGYLEQPEEWLLAQWQHWIATTEEFDPGLWLIACEGDEIAGVCLSTIKSPHNPDYGYVNSLAVRRPWRRRGLAIALLQQAFVELAERGKTGAQLHVDATNLTGATQLYERAGMRVARQTDWYEKQLRPGRNLVVAG